MEVLLFAAVLLLSLFLIPLGLPGTWIMVGAAIGYDALVGGNPIGWVTIAATAVLAVIAEITVRTGSSHVSRSASRARSTTAHANGTAIASKACGRKYGAAPVTTRSCTPATTIVVHGRQRATEPRYITAAHIETSTTPCNA